LRTPELKQDRKGFLDWMFRSRKTGRITLAQLPNWQLAVWLLASAVMWLGHPQGWARDVLVVLASAALALWAGDEVLRGVNPLPSHPGCRRARLAGPVLGQTRLTGRPRLPCSSEGCERPLGCRDRRTRVTKAPTQERSHGDNLVMSEAETDLAVRRWKRYGKDRLYVTGVDGRPVGWWDLLATEGHPESADLAFALDRAVSAWLARDGQTTTIEMVQVVAESTATAEFSDVVSLLSAGAEPDVAFIPGPKPKASPEHPVDLSSNRAGAMAREQALALKQAAPVRTFVARALGVRNDERAWRIGADGEEKVAAQLEKLLRKDPRWRVLHAVPVGERGSDIDHVVIGPGGVFTINAKHHPGAKIWVGGDTFMVNGQRQPYIRNSRHEAKRAARLLSASCGFPVEVASLVVPVRAADVTVKQAPDDVIVVTRARVARWLRKRPDVLRADAIEAIFASARRSPTWLAK
jgi:Nuclease-related domain